MPAKSTVTNNVAVVDVPQRAAQYTDASGVIQGAIDKAWDMVNRGAVTGARVMIPPGTYTVENIMLQNRVEIHGYGCFASVLKLKAGSTADLITTSTFAALTGSSSTSGIGKWGLVDVGLDGNKANCPSGGWLLRVYGQRWRIENVTALNGKAGGFWTEWGTGGIDMESRMHHVHIGLCDGAGWEFRGPHDSICSDIIIWGCDDGLQLNNNGNGLLGTNVHVWGDDSQPYGWVINTDGNKFHNAYADGSGVWINNDENVWEGKIINPSGTPGLTGMMMGADFRAKNCTIDAVISGFETAWDAGSESNNRIFLRVEDEGPDGVVQNGPHVNDFAIVKFNNQTALDAERMQIPGHLRLKLLSGDPSNPVGEYVRLFSRANGGGKGELCAIFNTGAVQVIATEP